MRTTTKDVKDWIEQLKNRNIKEFLYRDLSGDLKSIGAIKKAKSIGLIKKKRSIKDVTVWQILR